MIHDVSRLDYILQRINKDSLNPFKYSEMILNYEGKMIDEVNRMEDDLQTTEDDLQTTEDDLDILEDAPKLVVSFKLTRIV